MTEEDYLKATNRVKITIALAVLRDVLPPYGITEDELLEITDRLAIAQDKLFSSYELEKPRPKTGL